MVISKSLTCALSKRYHYAEGKVFALAKSAGLAALDRVDGNQIRNLIEALIGLLDQAVGDSDMGDEDLNCCMAGKTAR